MKYQYINIAKPRFIIGCGLLIVGAIKIHDYRSTGCLATFATPTICGDGALYYYYLYIGVFLFGLILFLTSFKRKSGTSGSTPDT